MLSAVSLSGHVERSSIFFTAVESQLGERQGSDLSSFMAGFVRTIWSLVIPRYEALTGSWEGGVEPITMLETRSHPPEMKSCFFIKEKQPFKGGRYTLGKNWPGSKQCLLSTMPRQICINNNYSPKWRWLVLDIYLTASQFGKYYD